jgi:hypothetical protein
MNQRIELREVLKNLDSARRRMETFALLNLGMVDLLRIRKTHPKEALSRFYGPSHKICNMLALTRS